MLALQVPPCIVIYVLYPHYLPYTMHSVTGVGGNLVAVQASRISTALHSCGPPGTYKQSQVYHGPLRTFFSKGTYSRRQIIVPVPYL